MLDVDPDLDHGLKTHLGIDEDCFTGVAPEPSAHEPTLIRETLRKLCGRSERQETWFERGLAELL